MIWCNKLHKFYESKYTCNLISTLSLNNLQKAAVNKESKFNQNRNQASGIN